jgi:hypothetical protein
VSGLVYLDISPLVRARQLKSVKIDRLRASDLTPLDLTPLCALPKLRRLHFVRAPVDIEEIQRAATLLESLKIWNASIRNFGAVVDPIFWTRKETFLR